MLASEACSGDEVLGNGPGWDVGSVFALGAVLVLAEPSGDTGPSAAGRTGSEVGLGACEAAAAAAGAVLDFLEVEGVVSSAFRFFGAGAAVLVSTGVRVS